MYQKGVVGWQLISWLDFAMKEAQKQADRYELVSYTMIAVSVVIINPV